MKYILPFLLLCLIGCRKPFPGPHQYFTPTEIFFNNKNTYSLICIGIGGKVDTPTLIGSSFIILRDRNKNQVIYIEGDGICDVNGWGDCDYKYIFHLHKNTLIEGGEFEEWEDKNSHIIKHKRIENL